MAISGSYPIPDAMMKTINACTAGLGAVGVIGGLIGPGADLVVIAPVWAGMVVSLANQAGTSMDNQTAKKVCVAAATAIGMFVGGAKAASAIGGWLLAIPTLGGSLAASAAVNAGLNAGLTRAFGCAVARYFLQTDKIDSIEVMAKVLIALVGLEFGIPSSTVDVVA